MNKQISSHYKLAWRAFVQALQATYQIPRSGMKAREYSNKVYNENRDSKTTGEAVQKVIDISEVMRKANREKPEPQEGEVLYCLNCCKTIVHQPEGAQQC